MDSPFVPASSYLAFKIILQVVNFFNETEVSNSALTSAFGLLLFEKALCRASRHGGAGGKVSYK
jgi:hypothetical protein